MDRPLFSDMLAERRRDLGYSIGQASRVLRLREDVLVAFEEGDFARMPKSGYAQGMLSSYARYLGLDAAEVVEAYLEDYEHYRHGSTHRSGRGRGGAPDRSQRGRRDAYESGTETYVAPRGLLPTSGGLAGDLGSFATTRVRSRGADGASSAGPAPDPVPAYPQSRPYTGRTPSTRSQRTSRTRQHGSRDDIRTMRYERSDYEDDLRLDRQARPFESASTRRGRTSSRNIGSTQRPRVRRTSGRVGRAGNASGRGAAPARRTSRPQPWGLEALLSDSSRLVALVVVAVILVLSLILVFSVTSCIRQDSEQRRTVPVSAASSDEATASSDAAQSGSTEAGATEAGATQSQETRAGDAASDGHADSGDASQAQEAASATSARETSVSVSVADGEVTWLEVECDGRSDVADTITGPWQRTYTVEDSLSVQASVTTAVTVVQNGRQLQFDSMASGIGTLHVQGTKVSKKDKASGKDGTPSADGVGQDSARTGNASSDTQQAAGDDSGESTQDDVSYEEGYAGEESSGAYADGEEGY